MLRKYRYHLLIILVLVSQTMHSQCAMCKAVVESGDAKMAEGLNTGILYLMAFPYIIVAVAGYLLYKNWKKRKL